MHLLLITRGSLIISKLIMEYIVFPYCSSVSNNTNEKKAEKLYWLTVICFGMLLRLGLSVTGIQMFFTITYLCLIVMDKCLFGLSSGWGMSSLLQVFCMTPKHQDDPLPCSEGCQEHHPRPAWGSLLGPAWEPAVWHSGGVLGTTLPQVQPVPNGPLLGAHFVEKNACE